MNVLPRELINYILLIRRRTAWLHRLSHRHKQIASIVPHEQTSFSFHDSSIYFYRTDRLEFIFRYSENELYTDHQQVLAIPGSNNIRFVYYNQI